jgi:hypothetical protein
VVVLDLDPTDNPLYGQQEGRHYSGYYKEYVYLPLYIFWGEELVLAKLRDGSVDAPAGTTEVLDWLVPLLRSRWPGVWIVLRADSAFAREEIMAWCEGQRVDYVVSVAESVFSASGGRIWA